MTMPAGLLEALAAPLLVYRRKLSEVTGGDAETWIESLFVDGVDLAIEGQREDRKTYFEQKPNGRCCWELPDTAYCDHEGPALLEQDELLQAHKAAWSESLKLIPLNESDGVADELCAWLELKVAEDYKCASEANKSMSNTFCEWLSGELFATSIGRKLAEGLYPSSEVDALHELMADFSRLDQCYLEQAQGPSKMDVLHQFVDLKMSESVILLTSRGASKTQEEEQASGNGATEPAMGQRMEAQDEEAASAALVRAAVRAKEEEHRSALAAKDNAHALELQASTAAHALELKAQAEAPAAFWKPLKAKEEEMKAAAEAAAAEAAVALEGALQAKEEEYDSALQAKGKEYESALAAKHMAHTAEIRAVEARAANAESLEKRYRDLDSAKIELVSRHQESQHSMQAAKEALVAQANEHTVAIAALTKAKGLELEEALAAQDAAHCEALNSGDATASSALESALDARDREHEQKQARVEEASAALEIVIAAKEAKHSSTLDLKAAELAGFRARSEELQSKVIESRTEADTLRAQARALRRDLSACSQRLKAATVTKEEDDEQRVLQVTAALRKELEAAQMEASQYQRKEKQWEQRLAQLDRSAAAMRSERSILQQKVAEISVSGYFTVDILPYAHVCVVQ
jgi:hypothetical protein